MCYSLHKLPHASGSTSRKCPLPRTSQTSLSLLRRRFCQRPAATVQACTVAHLLDPVFLYGLAFIAFKPPRLSMTCEDEPELSLFPIQYLDDSAAKSDFNRSTHRRTISRRTPGGFPQFTEKIDAGAVNTRPFLWIVGALNVLQACRSRFHNVEPSCCICVAGNRQCLLSVRIRMEEVWSEVHFSIPN